MRGQKIAEEQGLNSITKELIEICNHCGRSVAHGSGLFINRIPDFNDTETRISNGLRFPEGDFVCRECDSKSSDDE
jgi:hypothetical protein